MRRIKETKCTCAACNHTWYYGKQEVFKNLGNDLQNAGKSMMCCTGCVPAALIPTKDKVDLGKCPNCGSKAIRKEDVIHEVE